MKSFAISIISLYYSLLKIGIRPEQVLYLLKRSKDFHKLPFVMQKMEIDPKKEKS